MANLLAYRIGTLQKPSLPYARVAELGIQGLEMVWNEETTPKAVSAALKSHGLRLTSLHVNCPLEDDNLPRTMGEQAAQAAEMGVVYFFVSVHAGSMPKPQAYERLRRLGDAVGAHRIFLAMETHPDLCQNAANMLETMAGVKHPWVGVNFDTGNVYYYNHKVDGAEELEKVAIHVRGVHLKDTFGGYHDGNFPVLGEGIVDFAKAAELLAQAGYTGPCTMELEGGAFDPSKPEDLADKVGRSVAHLKKVGAA